MSQLDLAIVGNGSYSALIDRRARVAWMCLPRVDGDPVFSSLLAGNGEAPRGFFDVELEDCVSTEQSYERNTAIVVTVLRDAHGGALEITDFAPRFGSHGRMYRPLMLVRRLRPLAGAPRLRVRLRPASDWGLRDADTTRGSNHVRYVLPHLTIRLTTDLPVTYVQDEIPFVLETTGHLILGPDETLAAAIGPFARDHYEQTLLYWRDWTRSLSIPFEWQEAVIR
ncbi:MAG: trehalase-like domain-containing protein, partial [Myxococcota bacterium]|nr:trehalase-like domain-containing protein [Myxococcota bacterium]